MLRSFPFLLRPALFWGALLAAGLAGPGRAEGVTLGDGFLFQDRHGQAHFLRHITPCRWPPAELAELRRQLLGVQARGDASYDGALESLDLLLGPREDAGRSLSSSSGAAARAPRQDPAAPCAAPLSLFSRCLRFLGCGSPEPEPGEPRPWPLGRWTRSTPLLAATFSRGMPLDRILGDSSTFPPSLIGISFHRNLILRIAPGGEQQVLVWWDSRLRQWRDGSALPEEAASFPDQVLHWDLVTAAAVAPDGTLDFTTGRREIYRRERNGGLRRIAAWSLEGNRRSYYPEHENHALTIAPDGRRYVSDLRARRVFALEEQADGSLEPRAIAGDGSRFLGALGAEEATRVGLQPSELTAGPAGELYYVEFQNNAIKKLVRDGEGWRVEPVMAPYCSMNPFFMNFCFYPYPLKLAAAPGESPYVLDLEEKLWHDLQAMRTHRLDAVPGGLGLRVVDFAAVQGGVFFLTHDSSILFLETLPPEECCFDLAREALEARGAGDRQAIPRARRILTALMRGEPSRSREHLGALGEGHSPLGPTGLCEDLLFLTEDYLWNPWQYWAARWALWHLDHPEEGGPAQERP